MMMMMMNKSIKKDKPVYNKSKKSQIGIEDYHHGISGSDDSRMKLSITEARIITSKNIVTVWKRATYINIVATIGIVLFNGFKFEGFHLDNVTFITTIISLVVGSTILGTATKLLKPVPEK